MTRRYTREPAEALVLDSIFWNTTIIRATATWRVGRHPDGTTSAGKGWSHYAGRDSTYHDASVAARLPLWIARGEVTPVPVDINQEAATFKRAKKR